MKIIDQTIFDDLEDFLGTLAAASLEDIDTAALTAFRDALSNPKFKRLVGEYLRRLHNDEIVRDDFVNRFRSITNGFSERMVEAENALRTIEGFVIGGGIATTVGAIVALPALTFPVLALPVIVGGCVTAYIGYRRRLDGARKLALLEQIKGMLNKLDSELGL